MAKGSIRLGMGPGMVVGAAIVGALLWGAMRCDGPSGIPDPVAEAERPHSCDDPGCEVCKANRLWMEENPGKPLGHDRDAANSEGATVIYTGERYED